MVEAQLEWSRRAEAQQCSAQECGGSYPFRAPAFCEGIGAAGKQQRQKAEMAQKLQSHPTTVRQTDWSSDWEGPSRSCHSQAGLAARAQFPVDLEQISVTDLGQSDIVTCLFEIDVGRNDLVTGFGDEYHRGR